MRKIKRISAGCTPTEAPRKRSSPLRTERAKSGGDQRHAAGRHETANRRMKSATGVTGHGSGMR
ncbi:MAG: hypothetical protein MZV70_40495 [Desulfobacterales bacterium]|nr:hypothetical protein [Desulfobacterales bacterium]